MKPAQESAYRFETFIQQNLCRTGTRGFIVSGAIKDDLFILGNLFVPFLQLNYGNPDCSFYLDPAALIILACSYIDNYYVFPFIHLRFQFLDRDPRYTICCRVNGRHNQMIRKDNTKRKQQSFA
jgi:hypothetical protein